MGEGSPDRATSRFSERLPHDPIVVWRDGWWTKQCWEHGLSSGAETNPEGRESTMKHIKKAAVALAAAVAVGAGAALPAQAANQDGIQNIYELIYFYNSNNAGAWSDFTVNVANLAGYAYIGGGSSASGFGQGVKNNAASIKNTHVSRTAAVYYNSYFAGPSYLCVPGCRANLSPTLKNQNASHRWL